MSLIQLDITIKHKIRFFGNYLHAFTGCDFRSIYGNLHPFAHPLLLSNYMGLFEKRLALNPSGCDHGSHGNNHV
jgi:hypothetical protein